MGQTLRNIPKIKESKSEKKINKSIKMQFKNLLSSSTLVDDGLGSRALLKCVV